MSQLPDQLLKPTGISMMMPLNPNMTLLNQVPIPGQIPNQSNLPLNQNMAISTPGPENKSQPNDTSNYYFFN